MKCPKCGYLGFEASDRCRNCGYDFSLAHDVTSIAELPLQRAEQREEPLVDFDLSARTTTPTEPAAALDLDRILGAEPHDEREPSPRRRTPGRAGSVRQVSASSVQEVDASLPLFSATEDDTPLITVPRPARPPLAVRRTTPEIPRTRVRTTPRTEELDSAFQLNDTDAGTAPAGTPTAARVETRVPATFAVATSGRRLGAMTVDLLLLGSINAAVIYLTLALAQLPPDQISVLPVLPLVTFFALLDGGYLVAFTAASGQTIGKMLFGLRVLGEDGRRIDIAGSVLRAAGCGVSLLTAGLAYLPAFVTTDRRALHDRISGTRVISDR